MVKKKDKYRVRKEAIGPVLTKPKVRGLLIPRESKDAYTRISQYGSNWLLIRIFNISASKRWVPKFRRKVSSLAQHRTHKWEMPASMHFVECSTAKQ